MLPGTRDPALAGASFHSGCDADPDTGPGFEGCGAVVYGTISVSHRLVTPRPHPHTRTGPVLRAARPQKTNVHRPAEPSHSRDLTGASRSRGRVRRIVAGLGVCLPLVLIPIHVQWGMAAAAVAQSPRAIEILTAVLRESPDHAHACYQLGLAFLNEAQPGRAAEHLERALRSDPSLRGAWLDLGRAAESAGHDALSREAFERADRVLGLQPGNGSRWLLRGILLAEERRWRDAAGALEQAAEFLPGSPELYRWLAAVYWELGRTADAERAQRQAGALSPAGEEAPQ